MALRFFADHCVAGSVVARLREAGHEVVRLGDRLLPTDASDPLVIAEAQTLEAVLISLNGDFADLVNFPPSEYGGIVALQIRNHPEVTDQVVERLLDYLNVHPKPDHYAGRLLLVEAHRIRVRT